MTIQLVIKDLTPAGFQKVGENQYEILDSDDEMEDAEAPGGNPEAAGGEEGGSKDD